MLKSSLKRFWRRRSIEDEIDEEIQAHFALEGKLLEDRGWSSEEARFAARRSFGNRGIMAEQTRSIWVALWFERLWQDLQYAARTLLQNRTFTPAAILSIALGVGAATAVYSIADAVLLRPLPYTHSERLLWVAVRFPTLGFESLGSPDYVAWRHENRTFEDLAATQPTDELALLNGQNATEVHVRHVSANFLQTFGSRPSLGRNFTPDEELPNAARPLLLSDHFWRQHFASDPNVVGRVLRLDGQPYHVIGVLPRSFVFPADAPVDLLTTLSIPPGLSYSDRAVAFWHVYGRLKPGVSLQQAQADVQHAFDLSKGRLARLIPIKADPVCKPLQDHRIGNARLLLTLLVGAATCLLLIACANVSNLILARWSSRSGEFAIRAAIGAGRARLARQLLTEALFLTAAGSALGLLLVYAVLAGFVHYAGNELPRLNEIGFDGPVFAIAILLCFVTTLLFSGFPAWHASRFDLQDALQRASRPGLALGYALGKRALVACEAALCLVLLFGASLLLQTLWHLRNDHLGFEPEHVLAVSIPFKGTRLESSNRDALVGDLLTFLRRIPGVQYAAYSECTPLTGGPSTATFSRSDRPRSRDFAPGNTVHVCGAGEDYASAAGLRILSGRFFVEQDGAHADTLAVLNETAARRFFPAEDPLGKQVLGVRMTPQGPLQHWKTVVGVVSDSKNAGLESPAEPQAFVNAIGDPYATEVRLLVRGLADPHAVEAAFSAKLRSLDSGLAADYQPVSETIADMSAGARFNAFIVGSFAGTAFLMAVIGVYGVLAFTVGQRTQEIGIRLALGGERNQIFQLVLREGMWPVFIGIAAGLTAVDLFSRYLKSLLYGVSATDPLTLCLVALSLILAAAAAISIPARRAARVNPVIALRYQ